MIKYILGWLLVLGLRLLPFRPANVEPLMATLLPYSKRYGGLGGFIFGYLSIIIYDLLTRQVGSWTWITGAVYGLIGTGAYFYFKNRTSSAKNYVIYAIIGTLFFDIITGVAMGPLLYGQPFMEALTGQIPFTVRHLLSSIISTLILSMAIEKWIVNNPKLENSALLKALSSHI